jgi:mono/diheme cytochrome c family protein
MKQAWLSAASALAMVIGFIGLADVSNAKLQNSNSSVTQNSNSGVTRNTATTIYAKRCATCHGRDGRAKTFKAKFNSARDFTNWQWQDAVSDEQLYNSIMNGRGKMPAFGKKLSESQVDSLVSYVRSLKK